MGNLPGEDNSEPGAIVVLTICIGRTMQGCERLLKNLGFVRIRLRKVMTIVSR